MASYTLGGTGIQLLTSGTTRLFIYITAAAPRAESGSAYPPNIFHQGLLRPGNGDWFYPTIPVDATQQVLDLVPGVDRIGYSVYGDGVILVSEGAPPSTSGVTLSTSIDATTVPDGTALTITWAGNTHGTPRDWLTIIPAGAPLEQVPSNFNCLGGVGGWIYPDDCTGVGGGVTLVPSGSCVLSVNVGANGPGDYGAFLLSDDGSTVIASAPGFVVS